MAELVHSIREVGLLQPVVVRRTGDESLRAGHGRAPLAGRPGGRPRHDPGDRPRDRRRRHAARRAAGEPAPLPAEPAGGGGRLPAAARGLRLHPRGAGHADRPLAARRSATRSGCSSCRRPCSAGSPPACSRPATPGRCSPSRTPTSRTGSPRGSSPRASACAAWRRSSRSARPAAPTPPVRRRKPDRARARRPRRPALRPAGDPGQGRPRQAQGQDHRRVRLAGRPAADRRHHGPAQPERPADLSDRSTRRYVDKATCRLIDEATAFSAASACAACARRSAAARAAPRRRARAASSRVGRAAAVRRGEPPGAVARAGGRPRSRRRAGPGIAPCSSAVSADRVVAADRGIGSPTRIEIVLPREKSLRVVLGHHPLGAPEHHRDQRDAGRRGDPDRPGLELLDLHGPRDRGLGEDPDQLAVARGVARPRSQRRLAVGPVDLDVAAGAHDRAADRWSNSSRLAMNRTRRPTAPGRRRRR